MARVDVAPLSPSAAALVKIFVLEASVRGVSGRHEKMDYGQFLSATIKAPTSGRAVNGPTSTSTSSSNAGPVYRRVARTFKGRVSHAETD